MDYQEFKELAKKHLFLKVTQSSTGPTFQLVISENIEVADGNLEASHANQYETTQPYRRPQRSQLLKVTEL